jgi:hypothetical protein
VIENTCTRSARLGAATVMERFSRPPKFFVFAKRTHQVLERFRSRDRQGASQTSLRISVLQNEPTKYLKTPGEVPERQPEWAVLSVVEFFCFAKRTHQTIKNKHHSRADHRFSWSADSASTPTQHGVPKVESIPHDIQWF